MQKNWCIFNLSSIMTLHSFVDNYTNIKEKLNPNIIFEEYIPDCGVKTYFQIWFKRDTIFKDSILPLILKQIDKL